MWKKKSIDNPRIMKTLTDEQLVFLDTIVQDAQSLCDRYGLDPTNIGDIEFMIIYSATIRQQQATLVTESEDAAPQGCCQGNDKVKISGKSN